MSTAAARCLLAGLLLLAAISKAVDPSQLWTLYLRFGGDQHPSRPAFVLLVGALIAFEVALAVALLVGARRRVYHLATAIFLMFSLFHAWLAWIGSPISCGCLGPLSSRWNNHSAAAVQNVAVAILSVWLASGSAPDESLVRASAVAHPPPSAAFSSRNARTGFSLIELLVVIAVLVILIALTLPMLRSTRSASETTIRLAYHRQFLAGISMYAGDSDRHFPTFSTSGQTETRLRNRGWEARYPRPRFTADAVYWTTLLVPSYVEFVPECMFRLADQQDDPDFVPIDASKNVDSHVSTMFRLSHTTSAAPGYWESDAPPEDLLLLRVVRDTDISSPSLKGLLLDRAAGRYAKALPENELDLRVSVGMADGSASFRLPDPVHPPPVGWGVQRLGFGAESHPIMTTRGGVRGRDFHR